MVLNFREEIDKLDVSREEESPGGDTAEMILGVEEPQLDCRTTTRVSSYEVTKLSHDVAANLHHVLMDCLCLQRLNKMSRRVSSQNKNITSNTVLAA